MPGVPIRASIGSSGATDVITIDTTRALHIEIRADGQTRARGVGTKDLAPEEHAAAAKFGLNPAKWKEDTQRWMHSMLHPAPIAVVPGPLPDGAMAQVIRDPASPTPRLIVLSANTANDRPLDRAREALAISEAHAPTVHRRMVITMWPDNRFQIVSGTSVHKGVSNTVYLASPRSDEVQTVIAAAKQTPLVAIAGVGPAWVLQR